MLSAGTAWVLLAVTSKPLYSKSCIAPGRHPVAGLYGALASLTASGAALQWFKNGFLPEDFEVMNRVAAERGERVRELFFLPYQAGANYPLWHASARGVFAGLTLEHDRFDMARAIMEGVAFGVRRAVDDFAANGVRVSRIKMMGGAAKSDLWLNMVAAIAGVPVVKLAESDAGMLGAAAIAGVGAGLFPDYAGAAAAMVREARVCVPEAAEIAAFDAKFRRYDALWRALSAFYA